MIYSYVSGVKCSEQEKGYKVFSRKIRKMRNTVTVKNDILTKGPI